MFTNASSAVSMSSTVAGRSMGAVVSPPKESVNDPSVAVETMSCVDSSNAGSSALPATRRIAGCSTGLPAPSRTGSRVIGSNSRWKTPPTGCGARQPNWPGMNRG